MPPKKHNPKPKKDKPKAAAAASSKEPSPGSEGANLENTDSQHTGASTAPKYTLTTQERKDQRQLLELIKDKKFAKAESACNAWHLAALQQHEDDPTQESFLRVQMWAEQLFDILTKVERYEIVISERVKKRKQIIEFGKAQHTLVTQGDFTD